MVVAVIPFHHTTTTKSPTDAPTKAPTFSPTAAPTHPIVVVESAILMDVDAAAFNSNPLAKSAMQRSIATTLNVTNDQVSNVQAVAASRRSGDTSVTYAMTVDDDGHGAAAIVNDVLTQVVTALNDDSQSGFAAVLQDQSTAVYDEAVQVVQAAIASGDTTINLPTIPVTSEATINVSLAVQYAQSVTVAVTQSPTVPPTKAPTGAPTKAPTGAPTDAPTAAPTEAPTDAPTDAPTAAPTVSPTIINSYCASYGGYCSPSKGNPPAGMYADDASITSTDFGGCKCLTGFGADTASYASHVDGSLSGSSADVETQASSSGRLRVSPTCNMPSATASDYLSHQCTQTPDSFVDD